MKLIKRENWFITEKLIENAIKKGEIRNNIDPEMLAETMQSLLDGIGFNVVFKDENRDYLKQIRRGLEFFFDLIKVQPSADTL